MLVAESISANQVLMPFGRLEAVRCATTGPSCLRALIYSFTMYPSMLAIRAIRAWRLGPPEDPKNGRISPHSALPKRSLLLLLRTCRLLRKNQYSYVAFTWQLLPVPGRANAGRIWCYCVVFWNLASALPPIHDQRGATLQGRVARCARSDRQSDRAVRNALNQQHRIYLSRWAVRSASGRFQNSRLCTTMVDASSISTATDRLESMPIQGKCSERR